MKQNVGPNERYLRLALGLGAAYLALKVAKKPATRLQLASVALSGIMTGLSRYCPISQAVGIDNSQGPEIVHFDEKSHIPTTFAHRANMWQQDHGLRLDPRYKTARIDA
jgi:hypothetical protein